MSEIQDIIKQHFHRVCNDDSIKYVVYPDDWVEEAMQEYAEYYAKKCLEIAAKNAVIKSYIKPNLKGKHYRELLDGESYNPMETIQMYKIDKESIINITFPSHD